MPSYPEIRVARNRNHYACSGADELKFPDKCPHCGDPLVFSDQWGCNYKCGGTYSSKPQCQTHTDVFWGTCPFSAKD